ncbi:MAG: putative oxidoreductase [Myxococcaceae bacterium]|nr:putative oxidoreductase [Myxococcaceae bacterium]
MGGDEFDGSMPPHKTAVTMTSPGTRVSRRKVLKTSLAAVALASLGGVALAVQKTAQLARTPALSVFDPSEYAIFRAFAERVAPSAGAGAPGATELGIVQLLDRVLAQSDAEAQKAIKGALALFESALGGALVGERVVPFTHLSPAEQDRILAGWRGSSLGMRRTIFRALSAAVMSYYWGDPRTWQRCGYDGPPNVANLRQAYADNLIDLDALRATPLTNGT